MSLPNVPYAAQTAPQMVELDQTFAAVGAIGIVPCSATGTNIITLTPNANTPTISAYANYMQFSFVAANSSTGAVTLQVGALAALPVYIGGSATVQAAANNILQNVTYVVLYNSALNSANGGFVIVSANNIGPVLQDYIAGLTLSNDAASPSRALAFSSGIATDSTNLVSISLGGISKTISGTWVTGSGNAGLGTGLTLHSSTWYHVFPIINNGVADAYFDTSVVAGNSPAGTTAFRRIGSFLTNNASSAGQISISKFSQVGDEFLWVTPVTDVAAANPGTSAVTRTLSVPPGVIVNAEMGVGVSTTSGGGAYALISSLDTNDTAPGSGLAQVASALSANGIGAGPANVRTNTSQQVRSRLSFSDASVTLTLVTFGWIDTRGRFA